tara:strand:+ start:1482 stop:1721 length:240 start_codon:yes stop_codon:yes gene_type:complete
MSLIVFRLNPYILLIEQTDGGPDEPTKTAELIRRSTMKFLFKRNDTANTNHETRQRIEARKGNMSPFGAPMNALRPLIS